MCQNQKDFESSRTPFLKKRLTRLVVKLVYVLRMVVSRRLNTFKIPAENIYSVETDEEDIAFLFIDSVFFTL